PSERSRAPRCGSSRCSGIRPRWASRSGSPCACVSSCGCSPACSTSRLGVWWRRSPVSGRPDVTMTTLDTTGPNAEQIKYWNETAAPKWVEYQAVLDTQLEELGRLAMERARLVPGERVLDVGCGCGATTRALAARVGARGSAHGVDISAPMLARAAELTRAAGVGNVRFTNADAQTYAFEPGGADVLFSRFGVMFFTDPPAAFTNLRRALRPGGRVAFVCWQPLAENPWLLVPLSTAAQHIQLPPPPAPGAPGPFA